MNKALAKWFVRGLIFPRNSGELPLNEGGGIGRGRKVVDPSIVEMKKEADVVRPPPVTLFIGGVRGFYLKRMCLEDLALYYLKIFNSSSTRNGFRLRL